METYYTPIQSFVNVPHVTLYVLSYLEIKETLRLMHLNKSLYDTVNQYIKRYLLSNGLLQENPKQQESNNVLNNIKNVNKLQSNLTESEQDILTRVVPNTFLQQVKNYRNQVELKKKKDIGGLSELEIMASKLVERENTKMQMNYSLYLKNLLCREVLFTILPKDKIDSKQLIIKRISVLFGEGIKEIQIGKKFTGIKLHSDIMYIFKTEDFASSSQLSLSYLQKCSRINVDKFSVDSRNLFYTTKQGRLYVIFYDKETLTHELKEELFEVTIEYPVHDFKVCYHHILLIFNQSITHIVIPKFPNTNISSNDNILEEYKMQEKQEQIGNCKSQQEILSYYVFGLLGLEYTDINRFNGRFRQICGLPIDIVSYCIGAYQAYFVSNSGIVYECILNQENSQQLREYYFIQTKIFEYLSGEGNFKKINQVYSRLYFYFAIEQETIESLENWNNQKVLEWASANQFHDYINIMQYEKVSGHDLINASKQYLVETLGMKSEELQTKFLLAITKHLTKTYKPKKLYGWGQNNNGQLGTLTGSNFVPKPVKISLPELDKDDDIDILNCGWMNTSILTNKKRIFISDNYIKLIQNEGQEESKNNNNNNKNKPKQKNRERASSTNSQITERWIEITRAFTFLKDKRSYQIENLSICREYLGILGCYKGVTQNYCKTQKIFEMKSKEKFKQADQVLNRILWDSSLNKTDFVIGYEDKNLGLIDIEIDSFKHKQDLNKIKHFKKNGEIIWDRATRYSEL